MYYLLYWAVVLCLMAWKWHTGTLTDRKQAQIDDLKSFAHHLGERLDAEGGLGEGADHTARTPCGAMMEVPARKRAPGMAGCGCEAALS